MSHEVLGLVLLGCMFVVILGGFPISFTLIFLGIVFGYIGLGERVFHLMTYTGVRHHDRHGAGGSGAVHLHGLRARKRGAHEPAVPRRAAAVRARTRIAVPRDHLHRDAVRRRHRHRRRLGDDHRADGRARDDALGLRRAAVGRDDLRRRHARHPDPAERDARGHGTDAAGLGGAAVRGRAAAGPAARRPLPRLHDGARLAQASARAAAVGRGARRPELATSCASCCSA